MSNYNSAMVARIQAAAPVTLEVAKSLSSEFGTVSHRSVVAKATRMGVYQPAAKAGKSSKDGITKAEYLSAVRKALALPDRSGDLTKAELSALLVAIG
jgi:hypothetical protein